MGDSLLKQNLDTGLDALGQSLPAGARERLLDFLQLLEKWNRTWNLTAVRDPLQMVPRHVLDSLSVRPFLSGDSIADVGTGAGLPGLPLAIAEPDRQFVLIDSAGKRTRFVTQAAATLGLGNVTIIRSRAEDYRPESGFDTVVSRAFAALAGFVSVAGHLCKESGCMLAMKGQLPGDEIAELPKPWRADAVHALTVPGLDAQRHVVIMNKAPEKMGG